MAKTKIAKFDAAHRQLNAAIRMTFGGEDPIAVHTVISAAQRIVRDLCEQSGEVESFLRFTDWIRPGQEATYWRHMNAQANFTKHADRDTDQAYEFDSELSDFVIFFTIVWGQGLGFPSSPEITAFMHWFSLLRPQVMKQEWIEKQKAFGIPFEAAHGEMMQASRSERLTIGAELLKRLREQG